MVYNKIFIDSDILLDFLLERKAFEKFSEILLIEAKVRQINLFTSTLIFANVHYLVAKNFNRIYAKQQLKVLAGRINALPFDGDDLSAALNSEHIDFEDTIQFLIAQKHDCDLIISRNIKHYKKFSLPVLTAEQFLNTL